MVQFGESLDVVYDSRRGSDRALTLLVTMPQLDRIALENTNDARIKGFTQKDMYIGLTGSRMDVKAYLEVDNLTLKQDGRCEIDLKGKGKQLMASMDEQAELDAEHYPVATANVKAVNRNRIQLTVTDTIYADVSPGTRMKYDGNPVVIEQSPSEN